MLVETGGKRIKGREVTISKPGEHQSEGNDQSTEKGKKADTLGFLGRARVKTLRTGLGIVNDFHCR